MYTEPEPMQYYSMNNNDYTFPSSPPSAPPIVPFIASAPSAPPSIPSAPSAPSAPTAPPISYGDDEYEDENEESIIGEDEEEEKEEEEVKEIIQQNQRNNIQINNAKYSISNNVVEPSTPVVIKNENSKRNEPIKNNNNEKQPIINPVKIGVKSHIKGNYYISTFFIINKKFILTIKIFIYIYIFFFSLLL